MFLDIVIVNKNIGFLGIELYNDEGSVARSCTRFPSSLGFFINFEVLCLLLN
mgnify:CR=1 FL=1